MAQGVPTVPCPKQVPAVIKKPKKCSVIVDGKASVCKTNVWIQSTWQTCRKLSSQGTWPRRVVRSLVGKKESTRGMDHFPLSTPEFVGFDSWLASPCGKRRARSVRKEIVVDISKALKFIYPTRLNWESLLDEVSLMRFERELVARDVGVDRRLGKLERLGEAHRYLRFLVRNAKPPDMEARLAQIGEVEATLEPWKTKLQRRERLSLTSA